MKKYIFLSFLFCFFVFLCNAQENKDYILTLQKDTLFGKIIEREGREPITFTHRNLKVNYHPSTIQSFGVYRNDSYQRYKSLKSEGGRTFFVEILLQGKINLYKFTEENLLKEGRVLRYVYMLDTHDEDLIIFSSSTYQRILGAFFKEYPSLVAQLSNYSYHEVPRLIEQYNSSTSF